MSNDRVPEIDFDHFDLDQMTTDCKYRMLEIAELTGKQHKDVLKAIRNMEPAWEKVQGRKFALLQKPYQLPNGGMKMTPYYSLTKTECLYIATKFNDEARAKLVLRWEVLEKADARRQVAKTFNMTTLDFNAVLRDMGSPRGISELTGKQHNDVLKAIRKMEPAWAKVTQGNFSLSTYQDATGRTLPCYVLTKTECLYIATKFNDEARAKLVLRDMGIQ